MRRNASKVSTVAVGGEVSGVKRERAIVKVVEVLVYDSPRSRGEHCHLEGTSLRVCFVLSSAVSRSVD